MDIYCSTCSEPYELYVGDDEDRAVIESVRRGECPSCKGVKPITCHDCGTQLGILAKSLGNWDYGCDTNVACKDKPLCTTDSCWGEHEAGNHERKYVRSSKLTRAEASAVLYDVMGDDLDGVASMMDDAEYMGWIK